MGSIRVLVVDDSIVVRRMVTDILSADPDIEVVGTAGNGRVAVAKVAELQPDLVTMDIEMPEMDGIEAVRAIRATDRRIPIIMFSTLTERGASATFDALASGASDYVTKPASVGSVQASIESVRTQLVPRIRALTGRSAHAPAYASAYASASALAPRVVPAARTAPPALPGAPRWPAPAADPGARKRAAVLVIGSSTGGPQALATVLPALPASLGVPVLVVQHMPPVFTTQFAARLDRLCALDVVEATDGTPLLPGVVHVAPGDFHLSTTSSGGVRRTALGRGEPENFCRPAVDVLFRSAVRAFDGGVLAVVLTGMGADGRAGAGLVRAAGGRVLVQDRASSVVWGMPGAVATAGYADEVVALDGVADAVQRHLAPARSGAVAAASPGGAR